MLRFMAHVYFPLWVLLLSNVHGIYHLNCTSEHNIISGSKHNQTCVEQCPPDSLFILNNTCRSYCEDYSTVIQTERGLECRRITSGFHPRTCPPFLCNNAKPYCFETECVQHCPSHTLKVGNTCWKGFECPWFKPFRINNSCKRECPENKHLLENMECVENCTSNKYLYGKICVKECPSSFKIANRTCVDRCPLEKSYELHGPKYTECLSSCPWFSVRRKLSCILFCEKDRPFLFNNTCLTSCPISHPLISYEKTNLNEIYICTNECRSHMVIENDICKHKCSDNKVIFNNSCVFQCPYEYARNNRVCVRECPYVKFNGICLQHCPIHLVNYMNSCVERCPLGFYLSQNNMCVIKCPLFSLNFSCVHECPSDLQIDTDTLECVKHCNKSIVSIISYANHYGMYMYDKSFHCGSKCPDSFPISVLGCKLSCPVDKNKIYNGTCVENCTFPLSLQYKSGESILNGEWSKIPVYTCVSECPPGYLEYDKVCNKDCPRNAPYNMTNKCVSNCPEYSEKHICVEHCSKYIANNQCVSSCTEEYPVLNKNRCQKDCSGLGLKTKIRIISKQRDRGNGHSIPIRRPELPFNVNKRTECTEECPDNYIIQNGYCYDKCPLYKYMDTCVDKCPKEMPYDDQYTCVPQCPASYKYYEEDFYGTLFCTNTCYKFVLDKRCISKCPKEHNLIHDKNCLSVCPDGYLQSSSTCIKSESCKSYIYRKMCIKECPLDTFFYNTKFCIDRLLPKIGIIISSSLMFITIILYLLCFHYKEEYNEWISNCFNRIKTCNKRTDPFLEEQMELISIQN